MAKEIIQGQNLTVKEQWEVFDDIKTRVASGELASFAEIKKALSEGEIGDEVLGGALAVYMAAERLGKKLKLVSLLSVKR